MRGERKEQEEPQTFNSRGLCSCQINLISGLMWHIFQKCTDILSWPWSRNVCVFGFFFAVSRNASRCRYVEEHFFASRHSLACPSVPPVLWELLKTVPKPADTRGSMSEMMWLPERCINSHWNSAGVFNFLYAQRCMYLSICSCLDDNSEVHPGHGSCINLHNKCEVLDNIAVNFAVHLSQVTHVGCHTQACDFTWQWNHFN